MACGGTAVIVDCDSDVVTAGDATDAVPAGGDSGVAFVRGGALPDAGSFDTSLGAGLGSGNACEADAGAAAPSGAAVGFGCTSIRPGAGSATTACFAVVIVCSRSRKATSATTTASTAPIATSTIKRLNNAGFGISTR